MPRLKPDHTPKTPAPDPRRHADRVHTAVMEHADWILAALLVVAVVLLIAS